MPGNWNIDVNSIERFVARHKVLLCVAMLLLLLGLVGKSTPQRIYDERWHLDRADQLVRGRPVGEVFTEPTPSAVGPVYAIIHATIIQVVGDDVRLSRTATALSLVGCIVWVGLLLRREGCPAFCALTLLAASPLVVSSLMALTETPAVTFALAAFGILRLWEFDRHAGWFALVVAAGFMALAVLTRQSTASLLPALALVLYQRKRATPAGLAIVAGLPAGALLLLMALWGGLIPPGQEHMATSPARFGRHLLEASIYCAVMAFLINPVRFLRWPVFASAGTAATFNLFFGWLSYPVLRTVFPDEGGVSEIFRRLFWGAGLGIAVAYFMTQAYLAARNTRQMGYLLAVVLTALSCGFIGASFTSRYVVAAIPFIALLAYAGRQPTRGEFIGGALGIGAGLMLSLNSLWNYGYW